MADEPYPSLQVRFAVQTFQQQAKAIVDTGVDGFLYVGLIELPNQPRQIDALIIALGDEFLLGLATLNYFKVTFDHGRTLTVEP